MVVFHKQDKKLSFLATMIMVSLTQMPAEDCKRKTQIIEKLRGYKDEIINNKKVVATLMEHLADCLQKEERNDKHNNMIELIIVFFK